MDEILILRLRCGIPGCKWAMPVPGPTAFSPAALTRLYGRFRNHCAERHDLSPVTNELPGLDHAAFLVDTSRGGYVEITMDAVIEEVEFENSFDSDPAKPPLEQAN
jgi:hypothetical protein